MNTWPEIEIYLYSNPATEEFKEAAKIYAKKHKMIEEPIYIIGRAMLMEKVTEILKRK